MRRIKLTPKEEAICLIITGLIIGTAFMFNALYFEATVVESETISVSAAFSSIKGGLIGRNDGLSLCFEDRESLHIHAACVNDELFHALCDIEPGTTMEVLLHPNSGDIMEIHVGSRQLLDFQWSMEKMRSSACGFFCLGLFGYMSFVMGVMRFLSLKKLRRIYWLPPKGFGSFFLSSSDEQFKRKHPIAYWFVVALGLTAIVAPMIIYGAYSQSARIGLAGVAGTFIIGIGLFNFVAIIMNQYLGHLVSIFAFLLGALLIAIDMGAI